MTRSNDQLLSNAREHLRRLRTYVDRSDLDEDVVFDAICMRLSATIESVGEIDVDLRDAAFGSTWAPIWSVRNRIAHGYFYVDRAIIVATVLHDLDEFEAALDRLAETLGG